MYTASELAPLVPDCDLRDALSSELYLFDLYTGDKNT